MLRYRAMVAVSCALSLWGHLRADSVVPDRGWQAADEQRQSEPPDLESNSPSQQQPKEQKAPKPLKRPSFNDQRAPRNLADLQAIQLRLQEVFQRVRPAVVSLQIDGQSGSGVIVSPEGLVLTAAHVAMGPDVRMKVLMEDGRRFQARALGILASTDAAMVQITDGADVTFPHVPLEEYRESQLGDWVCSAGYPSGFDLERGVVLRLGRLVRSEKATWYSDCPLIGGDSGGPLFDLRGRLIGINSRVGKVKDQNMHVVIQEFLDHWDDLAAGLFVEPGKFAKTPKKGSGFLGAVVHTENQQLVVRKVLPATAAARAHLQPGDLLRTINGQALATREDLVSELQKVHAGSRITLCLTRNDSKLEIPLTLGRRPEAQ